VRTRLFAWLSTLAFFAVLLPNHYSPWASAHQDWTMGLAFLPLLLWATWGKNVELPAISIAAWGLALVPVIQFALGLVFFAGDAWTSFLYLSGFGLAVLTGSRYVRDDDDRQHELERLTGLFLAIVLAGIVSIGIAIHQWLDLKLLAIFIAEVPTQSRVFANLAQANQLATLLLLSIASLLFLFEANRIHSAVATIVALVFAFGLVMTGSRFVLLSMCWFWFVYVLLKQRCKLRLSFMPVAGITGFYLFASLSWPQINRWLLLDEHATSIVNRLHADIRTIYWQSMVDAISAAPWFGYGWAQVPIAQQSTALAYPPTHSFFESAHNFVLDLMLWNGMPIGLTCALLIAAWFLFQIRGARDSLSWSLLVAVGFVFTHSMVEFPLYYAYFLLPVGLWMGALSAKQRGRFWMWKLKIFPRLAHAVLATLALATTTVFIMISMEYPAIEEDWRIMRFEEQHLKERSSAPPSHTVILTQLSELMQFTRLQVRPNMTAEQLEWMRRVSTRYGYASNLYKYALATALNGNAAQAVQTLRILCSLHTIQTCSAAQKDWNKLGDTEWPQLKNILFPVSASSD
jgi:Virulence factor membrane-bound polymerase, C-terminal/O-Antigen ligase/Protein glycosylation ligase